METYILPKEPKFTPTSKDIIIDGKQVFNQDIKADSGKMRISIVPLQIIDDIAEVREYGIKKYKDPENWKKVEKIRYIDAAYRHLIAYIKDNASTDEESGIEHLKHLACNVAFLCQIESEEK